jgi:hypothetical protein
MVSFIFFLLPFLCYTVYIDSCEQRFLLRHSLIVTTSIVKIYGIDCTSSFGMLSVPWSAICDASAAPKNRLAASTPSGL